jgi:hypothetical protein
MSFTLNDGADTDGERSAKLRLRAKGSCLKSAIASGTFHHDLENLNKSKALDAQERADEERHLKGPIIHTPPPLAGGATKRVMVDGFSAATVFEDATVFEKEPLGRYQSNTFDNADWNKSDDPDKEDAGVAGDKNAKMKGSKDDMVAGLFGSSESSPGAGTPSTEGEEDDILDNKT